MNNTSNTESVSLFITSCARFDLLKQTLKSFHESNTYPLSQIILTEDSPYGEKAQALLDEYEWGCEVLVIKNGQRVGRLASIDKGYAAATTDYLFHCDDDWVFTRGGFIEDSLALLRADEKLFSVWLRDKKEFNDDLFGENYLDVGVKVEKEICSFNPSLRRVSDFVKYLPMAQYVEEMEISVSLRLIDQEMYSVLLHDSATDHIGWHRRLDSHSTDKFQLLYDIKDAIKRFKSKIYKKLKRGHFKQK